MSENQKKSTTYGTAKVSADIPANTPDHGPWGHTDYDQTDEAVSNVFSPEKDKDKSNMPCKNSLPT